MPSLFSLWRWSDVEQRFEAYDGSQHPARELAEVIAAVNDTLKARRTLARLRSADRRRVIALARG